MALSSINFQKSSGHSYKHNFRYDKPNYLLKENDWLGNDYWENELSAKEIFENELSKAHRRGGRIPKFENSHWEAVLNLNKEHTLDDVKKVADYLKNKLNITCATIAVHRDEGYYDKNGKACYNFHAHLTFVTYKNNQQNWRQEKVRNKLREIQTEVAEILKMERGIDKRESKRQRLEHREYKQKERELKAIKQELEAKDNVIQAKNQVIQDKDQELEDEKLSKKRLKEQIKKEAQEQESKIKEIFYDEIDKMEVELKEKDKVIQTLNQELEQEKLSKAELKKELEKLRQNSKNQGFSKEFFQEINLEKKKLRFDNKTEFFNWVEELRKRHTKKGILTSQLDSEAFFEDMYKVYQEPYKKIQAQDQEIQDLKAENTELKNEKERFHELLESDLALKEAYNQALKNLEEIKQKRTGLKEKIAEWRENNKRTLDKIEVSEQNQENNHDDLGIDKIIIHKNQEQTQEHNKPKIRKNH